VVRSGVVGLNKKKKDVTKPQREATRGSSTNAVIKMLDSGKTSRKNTSGLVGSTR